MKSFCKVLLPRVIRAGLRSIFMLILNISVNKFFICVKKRQHYQLIQTYMLPFWIKKNYLVCSRQNIKIQYLNPNRKFILRKKNEKKQ